MKPPLVVILPKLRIAPAPTPSRTVAAGPPPPSEKPSPVAVAHRWLGERLVEKESGFWLDGRPVSLDQVMQATNRLLKSAGIEQVVHSERVARVMLEGLFMIEHNIQDAVEQEYDLARKEYDEVCSYRNVFNKDHAEKFRAACERLNRARDLMFRVGPR